MLALRIAALLVARLAGTGYARRLQNSSSLSTARVGVQKSQSLAGNSPHSSSGSASSLPSLIRDGSASPQWSNWISPITRFRGGSHSEGSLHSFGHDAKTTQRKFCQSLTKSRGMHRQEIENAILRAPRMDDLKLVLANLQNELLGSALLAKAAQARHIVNQDMKGIGEVAQHGKDDLDDCEVSLGNLKAAICDPSVMAEAARMLSDPSTLAQVKSRMADPKFQQQAKHVTKQIMADSDLVTHLLDGDAAENAKRVNGDLMEEMLHDPETSEHVRDMISDPNVQKQARHIAEQMTARVASKASCSAVALLSLFDL
mmetsp:Transcript_86726/g.163526  ORF Transcript_86726/g.163526 Transcript_86726/m.163526 type:complete len:315 (-) Transcript_86726:119-1063(-)